MGVLQQLAATVRRFGRDQKGQFALITAILTPVAIGLAGFAVDVGSLYLEKRTAQGLADLAAITAAANVDKAEQAVLLALADNGIEAASGDAAMNAFASAPAAAPPAIAVVMGRYDPDLSKARRLRFTPGLAPHNAVRVTYRRTGTRFFAGAIMPPPVIEVASVAATSPAAAFSVGSRLLEVKDAGLLNSVLGGLTGSRVTLTAMDYNALANAEVDLFSFFDALAVSGGLTAGTYTQLLGAEAGFGAMARAVSDARGKDGKAVGGDVKAAAGKLARLVEGPKDPKLRLLDLVDLGQAGSSALHTGIGSLDTRVNALQLLTAGAILAGQDRQGAAELEVGVPGLLKSSVSLALGEPMQKSPWLRFGSSGELVRTAQTRLRIVAEVGGLLGVRVRIPLYLELASAEASLVSLTCRTGRPDSLEAAISARPGVANLYLAEVDPSKIGGFASPVSRRPAVLLHVPLLVSVSAQAQAEVANPKAETLKFSDRDRKEGVVRKVGGKDAAGGLVSSLLTGLEMKVDVLGLGLGIPRTLTSTLAEILAAAVFPVDDLLGQVLSTLGIALGQAHVTLSGATCGGSVLVQ